MATKPSFHSWREELLYTSGDDFFEAVLQAIRSAQKSIAVEVYIFDIDEIGRRFAAALCEAAARGVNVRVVVDSIGSLQSKFELAKIFRAASVQFQVYHHLPWERLPHDQLSRPSLGLFSLLRRINRRTHRKYFIIDAECVFVGGMNISRTQSESLVGAESWQDMGANVQGEAVIDFITAFEKMWNRRSPARKFRVRTRVRYPHLVRLNYTRRLRKRVTAEFLTRLRTSTSRIWITNAYFIPHRKVIDELSHAAERGVDVRIIVPERSDVFFVPWVASRFYLRLLRSHARLYEYTPSMLHSKSLIVDDWCVVGSSNLNHRSLLHDLEVDVVLDPQRAGKQLIEQFQIDLAESVEVSPTSAAAKGTLRALTSRFALFFEKYL